MPSRRDLLKYLSRLVFWAAAARPVLMGWPLKAMAWSKRHLLPPDTDPETLSNRNPATLDTRNLQVMPIEAFRTMGDRDAPYNPEKWGLEIDGAVKTPLRLSRSELKTLPAVERNVLLVCPGIFSLHGRWKGILIGELLGRTGVSPDATRVTVYGRSRSDVRQERFPITEVQSGQIFLAYGVNGRDLPRAHGFPLRVVAEGRWGADWVKFVYRVEVT